MTAEIVNGILDALASKSVAVRYSEDFYKFAFMLRAKSVKCYELLRHVLPFPTSQNVNRKFRDDFIQHTRELTDPQLVPGRIQGFPLTGMCTMTRCLVLMRFGVAVMFWND